MTHLGEGRLRTLLDGELSDSDAESARAHLDECDSCQALFTGLGEASTVVGVALRHLDTVAPPAGAKESVLARVGMGSGDAREARFTFARAAIIVLFFGAVVATALPASPVRGWFAAGWDRAVELFTGPAADENAALPAGQCPLGPDTRVGRRSPRGGDRGAPRPTPDIEPGTVLDVRFVDGFQAAAFAAQPARFRTAEGRIEVIGGSGRIRVDIPRSVDVASIQVNGRMYIRKAGDELDVAGPDRRADARRDPLEGPIVSRRESGDTQTDATAPDASHSASGDSGPHQAGPLRASCVETSRPPEGSWPTPSSRRRRQESTGAP